MTRLVSWAGSSHDFPDSVCACLVLSEACSQVKTIMTTHVSLVVLHFSSLLDTLQLVPASLKCTRQYRAGQRATRSTRLTAGKIICCCCKVWCSGMRCPVWPFICQCTAKMILHLMFCTRYSSKPRPTPGNLLANIVNHVKPCQTSCYAIATSRQTGNLSSYHRRPVLQGVEMSAGFHDSW